LEFRISTQRVECCVLVWNICVISLTSSKWVIQVNSYANF
jgi:hypothetical protein